MERILQHFCTYIFWLQRAWGAFGQPLAVAAPRPPNSMLKTSPRPVDLSQATLQHWVGGDGGHKSIRQALLATPVWNTKRLSFGYRLLQYSFHVQYPRGGVGAIFGVLCLDNLSIFSPIVFASSGSWFFVIRFFFNIMYGLHYKTFYKLLWTLVASWPRLWVQWQSLASCVWTTYLLFPQSFLHLRGHDFL